MTFSRLKQNVLVRNIALILIVLGLIAFFCGFFYSAYTGDFLPSQDAPPAVAQALTARVAASAQVQNELYNWGRISLGLGIGVGVLQTVARVLSGARRKA